MRSVVVKILVIAALVLVAIGAQSTPDDDDYFDDNTGDQAPEPKPSTEEPSQPTVSSSPSSLEDSPTSQPTVQTMEKDTNPKFVYVPAPPNPFPNFVPMPPFYPGQPPQPMPPFYPGPPPQPMAPFFPGQPPQYPFIQPPMPMMFPPPPPPSFMQPGEQPPNGQAAPYPQPNQAGQPQLVLVNQHKNPAGYVMGETSVYLKPDRNQEYIIIKSN